MKEGEEKYEGNLKTIDTYRKNDFSMVILCEQGGSYECVYTFRSGGPWLMIHTLDGH
jgi:hypothetical protein